MKHLIIENVGPIKRVELVLKKFNFFIGPQSSGKSTIAKIYSTCSWVEKEVATSLNDKAVRTGSDFKKLVESFHKMTGYFNDNSYIRFETDSIVISYKQDEFKIVLKDGINYDREKICYIPSERNMVSLQDLSDYKFEANNLKSFSFDWFTARELYDSSNKAKVLNLGVSYYFDKDELTNKDKIEHNNGKSYKINLSCASSGLQSVVPLLVMMRYYTEDYFNLYDNKISFDDSDKDKLMRRNLADELLLKPLYPSYIDEDRSKLMREIGDKLLAYEPEYVSLYHKYQEALNRLTIPKTTSFIIEEPEQNLFPYTQIQLVDYIVSLCTEGRDHSVTITTHSPYIINALNLHLLRYYKHSTLPCVNPDDINVFSVQDGLIVSQLMDNPVTGLKSVNVDDLSEAMQDMYQEYKELKSK